MWESVKFLYLLFLCMKASWYYNFQNQKITVPKNVGHNLSEGNTMALLPRSQTHQVVWICSGLCLTVRMCTSDCGTIIKPTTSLLCSKTIQCVQTILDASTLLRRTFLDHTTVTATNFLTGWMTFLSSPSQSTFSVRITKFSKVRAHSLLGW